MSNYGIGVYILTVLWLLSLLYCWISVRTGHPGGRTSIFASLIITITLVAIPKGDVFFTPGEYFYDNLLIVRYGVLGILVVSLICGTIYSVLHTFLMPVETKKVLSVGKSN